MIRKFFRDETGLELSEYAVAAALVAIAVVGAFGLLGDAVPTKLPNYHCDQQLIVNIDRWPGAL